MFDHMEVPVADLDRSRRFYDAALLPLGLTCQVMIPHRPPNQRGLVGYGREGDSPFGLLGGGPVIGTVTIAFRAPSCAAVEAFRLAGLAAGGAEAPGSQPLRRPQAPACRACLLDPDGHVVEAFCAVAV